MTEDRFFVVDWDGNFVAGFPSSIVAWRFVYSRIDEGDETKLKVIPRYMLSQKGRVSPPNREAYYGIR